MTIEPPPWASIAGMTARMSFMVPVTLTRKTRSHTASDTSPTGVMSSMIPAMFARPSIVLARGLDDARDAGVVGDVGGERDDVGAGVLGDELVEALLADVDRDHAAALAGDARCGGAADARAGTRHDDGLAGEAALVDALGPLAQRGRRMPARRRRPRLAAGAAAALPAGTSPAAARRTRSSSISCVNAPRLIFTRRLIARRSDGLEDVGRLAALGEHVGEDRVAGRVGEPVGDRGVAGERRGGAHDVTSFLPDNYVRY